ncbi:MAG: hypothetical protein WEB58_09640 [Planctomycetaceae bacterium]
MPNGLAHSGQPFFWRPMQMEFEGGEKEQETAEAAIATILAIAHPLRNGKD